MPHEDGLAFSVPPRGSGSRACSRRREADARCGCPALLDLSSGVAAALLWHARAGAAGRERRRAPARESGRRAPRRATSGGTHSRMSRRRETTARSRGLAELLPVYPGPRRAGRGCPRAGSARDSELPTRNHDSQLPTHNSDFPSVTQHAHSPPRLGLVVHCRSRRAGGADPSFAW